jgi:hypothetical protein
VSAPVSESQWQYIRVFKKKLSVIIYSMGIEKYLTKDLMVTIKWNVLNEICRSELVERLCQTLLTFLQHWIPGVEPPDAVTIYRTYHAISHYQNQFPALIRTESPIPLGLWSKCMHFWSLPCITLPAPLTAPLFIIQMPSKEYKLPKMFQVNVELMSFRLFCCAPVFLWDKPPL